MHGPALAKLEVDEDAHRASLAWGRL
jgi:hypothetical protein